MAVFRVEKTKDYTVISNHHLRDMNLSLKAKGLLSLMLSLPETWNYTLTGLAKICKEGVDSIRSQRSRRTVKHNLLCRGIRYREQQNTKYIIEKQMRAITAYCLLT